ncbi:MAG TPA: glycosyltransferase [Syntrophomonadaceae bacterium]|nr:glycosyltransferase [Syntrophomonadaceae bacterium]
MTTKNGFGTYPQQECGLATVTEGLINVIEKISTVRSSLITVTDDRANDDPDGRIKNKFDDTHIFRMTDDTGMFQHARFGIPDLDKGYTTDDNARALIMAVMLHEEFPKIAYLSLVYRYLGFVLYAQNESGGFRNFMTYSRQFTEEEGSEDCFGRCLWALGYTMASPAMPKGIKRACAAAVKRALSCISTITSLRGQANTIIGLGLLGGNEADSFISILAQSLLKQFEQCASKEWHWFEDKLTYDNAVLPGALFVAYRHLGQGELLHTARESLDFLDQITFRNGYFQAIGCKGWMVQGAEPAQYDEQPIEACATALTHLVAYDVAGDGAMLELARQSFAWYLGTNSCGESLIDSETGGCCDGITSDGINQNQGAESIVGYCIANLSMERYKAVDDSICFDRMVSLR